MDGDDPESTGRQATVVMYSRRTCGLCDKARAVILGERDKRQFDFEEILIDEDEELERKYGLRVPVVEIDGEEQFEIAVEPARLRALL